MNKPDAAKNTVSGLLKFADGAFGKGTKVILKLFNAAATIAGLVPGASVAGGLKLSKDQQKSIEDSLNNISKAASDLAAVNAPAGQLCSDTLNGKKAKDQPADAETSEEPSSEETTSEAPASEDSTSEQTTEPSTTEAAAVPGKDADLSSVAGFSFLAALVGGGTVLGHPVFH